MKALMNGVNKGVESRNLVGLNLCYLICSSKSLYILIYSNLHLHDQITLFVRQIRNSPGTSKGDDLYKYYVVRSVEGSSRSSIDWQRSLNRGVIVLSGKSVLVRNESTAIDLGEPVQNGPLLKIITFGDFAPMYSTVEQQICKHNGQK